MALNRRSFLKSIGLGFLVAPAAVEAAKGSAEPEDAEGPPPLAGVAGTIDRINPDGTAWVRLGPAPAPRRLSYAADPGPEKRYECWGSNCQMYGKPHHAPWECSIKFNADGTVRRPDSAKTNGTPLTHLDVVRAELLRMQLGDDEDA